MGSLFRAAASQAAASRLLDHIYSPGGGTAVGGTPDLNFVASLGSPNSVLAIIGGTSTIEIVDGKPVVRMAAAATGAVHLGLTTYVSQFAGKVTAAGIADTDLEMDPIYRWRGRFRRTQNGAVRGGQSFGFGLWQSASTAPGLIGTGTGAGISLNMNAAGNGWELIAKQVVGGALTLQRAVSWPNDQLFTTWEMRITPAGASGAAVLQLFRDDVLVTSENWALNTLPIFTGGGAPYRFIPAFWNAPAATTDFLDILSCRITKQSQV